MTSLQQLEYLPGARHDRGGESREPAHVNPIGAVGATRLEPVQEHDFLADLAHRDVEVANVLELLGELRQLVIMRRKDRLAPDAVVQALGDRPGDRDAIVGRCATADLIEQHQAPARSGVQDRARLTHLDHKGRLAAHQVVGRADAREKTIHDAYGRTATGYERSDLREHDAESHLTEQRGLAGHIGPGEEHDSTCFIERHVVGDERFARHHSLDDGMPAALELQRELARDLRPHVTLALGDVGQRGPDVETRQVTSGRLDPGDHLSDASPQLVQHFPLAYGDALLGTQDLGFVLLQIWRDVALRTGQRLAPLVIGRDAVAMGVRDLDVVAEDLVESDLERPNTRALPLA